MSEFMGALLGSALNRKDSVIIKDVITMICGL
jgi:hypothetical protein